MTSSSPTIWNTNGEPHAPSSPSGRVALPRDREIENGSRDSRGLTGLTQRWGRIANYFSAVKSHVLSTGDLDEIMLRKNIRWSCRDVSLPSGDYCRRRVLWQTSVGIGLCVRTPRAEGGAGTSRAVCLGLGFTFVRHAPRAARVHRAPCVWNRALRSCATRRGRRGYIARRVFGVGLCIRTPRAEGGAGTLRAVCSRYVVCSVGNVEGVKIFRLKFFNIPA